MVAVQKISENIEARLQEFGLTILCHTNAGEVSLPDDMNSALLISPTAKMWRIFTSSSFYNDKKSNPLDRWSKNAITQIANEHHLPSIFPSDKPYVDFFKLAIDSGQIWQSPIQFLVSYKMGLLTSFRGAICLPDKTRSQTKTSICTTCTRPCLNSCPADAFTNGNYDVPKCRNYLNNTPQAKCHKKGCIARLSCPASNTVNIPRAQNQFHLNAFLNS